MDYDATETIPLVLTVSDATLGGQTGLAPTVAVRHTVTGLYLDWTDSTFKAAGWGVKYQAMAEVERGTYQRLLALPAVLPALTPGTKLSAEYHVVDAAGRVGDTAETFRITTVQEDMTLVRKYHTNRLHYTSGAPGLELLYDDDDTTVLRTHLIRDEAGGAVAPAINAPARRSKGA